MAEADVETGMAGRQRAQRRRLATSCGRSDEKEPGSRSCFRPVFSSNDYLVQLAAAGAGAGVMVLGRRFHCLSRIGQLVELDPDLGPSARTTVHLVVAKRMVDVPRIRAVADALLGELDPPAAR